MVTPPLTPKKQGLSVKSSFIGLIRSIKYNKTLTLGIFLFVMILVMALFADVISPYSYDERFPSLRFAPPSLEHPFGTNLLGYDVLARVIYGARIALLMAFSGTILAYIFGIPLGVLSGYFGGKMDRLLTLIADAIYSFPSLLFAIVFAIYLAAFGILKTVAAVSFATAVVYIPTYFRVVRAQVLQIKKEGYVDAAKTMGAGRLTILLRYITPNILASTIAIIPFNMTDAILTNAGLAFLGLGIQPPTADWGYDVYENRSLSRVRTYPWLIFFPGLMIFVLSFAFSLIGDALNDKFNPLISRRNNAK
ncbi:MAG: ABC transporter permease [Candidatus Thorarchaeota archaeon]